MVDTLNDSFSTNNNDFFLGKTTGRVLRFSVVEDPILSSFEFSEGELSEGEVLIPFDEVGDAITYEALLTSDGQEIGITQVSGEIVQERGNGTLVLAVRNVYDFGGGDTLTLEGNATSTNDQFKLTVSEGTGIFESVEGKATVQTLEDTADNLDDFSVDFQLLTGGFGANNDDPFLGKGKEVFRFSVVEVGGDLDSIELGDIPGFNELGDGGTFSSELFDENGVQVGTSDSGFEVIKELESDTGAVNRGIASVFNTLEFEEGTISIEGTLNIEEFEDLEPFKLEVTGGTGIYEGAKGKAIFQQQQLDVLNIVEIDLQVIA